MQPRRVMLLNHEAPPLRRRNCAIAARFGGFAEIALRLVAGKTTTRHRAPGRSFMRLTFCSATNLINLSSYSVDILLGHESGQSFHRAVDDGDHRAVVIAGNDLHRSLIFDFLRLELLLHVT